MSRKNKLKRFAEMKEMSNVTEPLSEDILRNEYHNYRGNWKKQVFKNPYPITLELGCGKGEYSLGLAQLCKKNNFIGIDIKGARMWVGAKRALLQELNNIHFLRTKIDFIAHFFEPQEIDDIWITFPDPQPQKNRRRKRLTSPLFIERYKKFLKPGGYINLKTDSDLLYEYSLEVIQEMGLVLHNHSSDIYNELERFDTDLIEKLNIKTYYENSFLSQGKKIKYLSFSIHAK